MQVPILASICYAFWTFSSHFNKQTENHEIGKILSVYGTFILEHVSEIMADADILICRM